MKKSILISPLVLVIAACASSPLPSSYTSVIEFVVARMESNAGILGKHLTSPAYSESDALRQVGFEAGRDQLSIHKALQDYCLHTEGQIARKRDSLEEFSDYLVPDYSGGYRELLFPGIADLKLGGGGLACTNGDEINFFAMYFTRPYFSRNDGVYDLTDYLVLEKRPGVSNEQFAKNVLPSIRSFSLELAERLENGGN